MKHNEYNIPFWVDLMASWKRKSFVLGTYYKTLQDALDNAESKNIYHCNNGYIVTGWSS